MRKPPASIYTTMLREAFSFSNRMRRDSDPPVVGAPFLDALLDLLAV